MTAASAIPETLPADFQDQIVRACAELGTTGPIVVALGFAGRLDEARLARATRLLMDADPILGCRFADDPVRPLWRRRDDLDAPDWCVVHAVADETEGLQRVLAPGPDDLERNLRVHLLRHDGGDTVAVWVSHVVADGTAAGDVATRLAALYTRLGSEPDHLPEPNPAPRDSLQWMADLTARDALRILRRDIGDGLRGRGPVHGLQRDYESFRAAVPGGVALVSHDIAKATVSALDRAAAERGRTRNDLLLAAFLRAFAAYAGQGPKARARVALPNNLRRYAPARRHHAICNMGGIAYVSVGPDLGAGFDDTLAQVAAEVERQKKGLMGAANPLAVRLMARMGYGRKKAMVEGLMRKGMRGPVPPTFTNIGRLRAASLRFDGAAPARAAMMVHPGAAPLFLCCVLEYEGVVTLTVCVRPAEIPEAGVRALLQQVERELPAAPAPATASADKEIA